jgi:hypothetical protein
MKPTAHFCRNAAAAVLSLIAALACSAQVRYLWEGTPMVGDQLVFTQVYSPHAPYRPSIHSNAAGAKADYADELQATAGASGIQVVRDDPEASVLRLERCRALGRRRRHFGRG